MFIPYSFYKTIHNGILQKKYVHNISLICTYKWEFQNYFRVSTKRNKQASFREQYDIYFKKFFVSTGNIYVTQKVQICS